MKLLQRNKDIFKTFLIVCAIKAIIYLFAFILNTFEILLQFKKMFSIVIHFKIQAESSTTPTTVLSVTLQYKSFVTL